MKLWYFAQWLCYTMAKFKGDFKSFDGFLFFKKIAFVFYFRMPRHTCVAVYLGPSQTSKLELNLKIVMG